MVVRPTVTDTDGFGKELLAVSPDLLGSMVKMFAEALMGADVDGICNAEYGEYLRNGSIAGMATGCGNGTSARARSSWPSRSCARARISR
ncbi:hypothetical protein FDG2_4153 [Candidatus Protofrankia californiensis]|uniref:Uncharacterized protein n=1 Tax=Candidatus Protofrankia californiensis TaxID=1839754 RepID=A0A1C3P3M7_9ACTN|nr:hypothetical protein FDG2_4153 [Candidatus Protofrankia californiensis]